MRFLRFFKSHPKITLLIFIVVTALIVYHRYFFGGYIFMFEDIGSDTKQQYVAWFNSIAFHLKHGDASFWDATWGFGTSMFSMNLFHPSLGILYIIGATAGVQYIPGALIYIHLLHLALAGLGCYLFLSSFRLSQKSRLIAAYIYSFNGYIVMWGQHYHFALFLFYMPVILCLIERSLAMFADTSPFSGIEAVKHQKRALIFMPIAAGVMCLSGYYLSYMVALASFVYIILRFAMIRIRPVKKLFAAFFSRCVLLLLGAGMGMVYMLPSFTAAAESSSRLASAGLFARFFAALAPYDKTFYMSFFKKLCSSSLEGIGIYVEEYTGFENVYESPNIFFTGLFILLIIQFIIFFPKIAKTLRMRIVLIISLVIVLAICFVPAASLVFNGFAYPFSRHLFVLMPVFAVLVAFMLDFLVKNRRFSVIGALISAAFTAFFCLRAIPSLVSGVLQINAGAIFITTLIMAVLFIIFVKRKKARRMGAFAALITIMVICQLISNTFTTVHRREAVAADSSYFSELYGKNDQELDKYLAENETQYYRLEKTFAAGSTVMDSLLQDYRGISGYNSIFNKYILEFADKVCPELRRTDNTFWLSFRNIENRPVLLALFGIKYVVTDDMSHVPEGYEFVVDCGDTFLFEHPDMTFAHFYEDTISESAFEEAMTFMDPDDILSDYMILSDADCEIEDAAGGVPDIDSNLFDVEDSDVYISETDNDGILEIELESDRDGYLFVPIPYENGWTAAVDGQKSEILRADYGFAAVYTQAGSHLITFTYKAPRLMISAAASLVCLIIFVILVFFIRRRYKRLAKA